MKDGSITNEQMAAQLGISLEELLAFMFEQGLIDEHGSATRFALDNGLLSYEIDLPTEQLN